VEKRFLYMLRLCMPYACTVVRHQSSAFLQALHLHHLPKLPVFSHPKLVVGPSLHHPPLVEHIDPVGAFHRREPVRNNHDDDLLLQRIDAVLNVLRRERSDQVLSECATKRRWRPPARTSSADRSRHQGAALQGDVPHGRLPPSGSRLAGREKASFLRGISTIRRLSRQFLRMLNNCIR